MNEDWQHTHVLITGGSQGIGLGLARSFARVGARVAISGRDRSRLEDAAQTLAAEGYQVNTVAADVSKVADCARMVQEAAAALGALDVLCANAGMYPERRIEDLTEAELDAILGTNLKGTIFSLQAALPHLADSGRGRVIVTTSITGPTTGYPGLSAYASSKAAQLGFVRTAAVELARRGVTVNAVSPGAIRTEGLDGLGAEAVTAMTRAIPAGRLGEPDDIGAAAVFLASRAAAFITGQEITVDGGQTLPEFPDLV